MDKYSTFIELSPHYESVVDIDSEKRNPDTLTFPKNTP